MTWNYKWHQSTRWDLEQDWISPYEDSEDDIRFTYWWYDMKADEVKELVKEAYITGYRRGLEDAKSGETK